MAVERPLRASYISLIVLRRLLCVFKRGVFYLFIPVCRGNWDMTDVSFKVYRFRFLCLEKGVVVGFSSSPSIPI